eukprot:4914117-Prorocentrum_lima.AAC.1
MLWAYSPGGASSRPLLYVCMRWFQLATISVTYPNGSSSSSSATTQSAWMPPEYTETGGLPSSLSLP